MKNERRLQVYLRDRSEPTPKQRRRLLKKGRRPSESPMAALQWSAYQTARRR